MVRLRPAHIYFYSPPPPTTTTTTTTTTTITALTSHPHHYQTTSPHPTPLPTSHLTTIHLQIHTRTHHHHPNIATTPPQHPTTTSPLPHPHPLPLQARGAYQAFLGQLFALVDGSIDAARYEESCRLLLGNHAYVLFTLDKVGPYLAPALTFTLILTTHTSCSRSTRWVIALPYPT